MKNRIILLALMVTMATAGFSLSTSSLTVSAKAASAMPLATQEEPLTEEEVAALLDTLKLPAPYIRTYQENT